MIPKEALERVWFRVSNELTRYDMSWDGMEEFSEGDYVGIGEVLLIIQEEIDAVAKD